MDFSLRSQLVDLLCEVPASDDFAGRTALFAGLPDLARDEGSKRVDLTNAVEQLERLGGDLLVTRLVDNALEFTAGSPLGARISSLRPAPALSRAELQITALDFDLALQQQALLDAVLAGKGLVGCAIRTNATVVQRVLTERLRDQLGPANLSVKEPVMLSPTRPAELCLKRLGLYRPELSRRDVLVPLWAFSTDGLASAWRALTALTADTHADHNLIALIFVDDAVLLPSGVTELPTPRVSFADLYAWTLGCLRKLAPPPADPEARAKRWSRALMVECTDADGMLIDRVFEALDIAVESLKFDTSESGTKRSVEGLLA